MFRTLLALAAVSLVSSLCLDAGALLCVDWSTTAGVVTFNSTCSPYQGSATTWCAFGVAATKPLSMFPADVAAVTNMYANAAAWQTKHQRRVLMGEAGCQVAAPSRADRLLWYQTVGEAQKVLSDSLAVWDDDGSWKIYDRTKRTFDAGVLSALGLSAATTSQA